MRSRTAVLKARSVPRLPAICCSEKLMKTAALPIATSARTQKISRTPRDRIGNGLRDALGPAQSTTNRTARRPAEAGRYDFGRTLGFRTKDGVVGKSDAAKSLHHCLGGLLIEVFRLK